MENIRSQLFDSTFGGGDTHLRFGKLSFNISEKNKRQTALGRELSLGEQAVLPIHGMEFGRVSRMGGKTLDGLHGWIHESDVQGAVGQMFNNSNGSRNISFFYDTELPTRFAYEKGVSPMGSKAAIVPVKQMMQEAFPGLGAADTSQRSMVAALEASPSAEAAFVRKMAHGLGGPLSSLGATAQLEAMTYGAADKMGLSTFKQFLARFGVGGLSDVEYSLFNINDPHNIDRYMGQLNVIPHGIKNSTTGKSLHLSGGDKLDHFTHRLRKAYGRTYANTFRSFANDLLSKAGDPHEISFLMTQNSRLFVGLTGRSENYYPLPLETAGQMKYNSQYATARPILKSDGRVVSASSEYMQQFLKGFGGFGTKGGNVGASLEKGHIFANREAQYLPRSGMNEAVTWKGIKDPATSMGRLSFFAGMYDQMTVRKGSSSNQPFQDALFGDQGLVSRRLATGADVRGGTDQLLRSVQQELTTMGGMGGGIDPYMYPAIKANFSGVYPVAGMRSFYLPNSFSSRDYLKGTYQARGKQEIYLPSELQSIKASRASLGYASRSTPVGMMAGDMAANRQLRRVWSKLRGKLTTPVSSFPLMVGSIDSSDGAAMAYMFGDSGALRTASGTRMLRRSRPTETLERAFNENDTRRFLGALSGGASSSEWNKLNRQLLGGQTYLNLNGGLDLSSTAGQEVRKMFGSNLPMGAKKLIGAQYQQFTDSVKYTFGTSGFSRAPVDALLVNNTRISARSVGESYLQKGFGSLGRAVDIITSEQNMSAANRQERAFYHRTGLLGTKHGQASGGVAGFMKRYASSGGVGLEQVGDNIVPNGAFNYANFTGASGKALVAGGFSPGQIQGHALSAPGRGAGMLSLQGLPENIGASGKLGTAFIHIGVGSQRAKEAADILSSKRTMSIKLESLNTMAQSMAARFGGVGVKTAWMHPAWALMAGEYENSTKLKLNRGSSAPSMFVKSMPQNLKNLVAPLSSDFASQISRGQFHGYDVLTRQQAYRKFVATEGGINTKMLNRKGISNAEIKRTKLMEAGRKGFFLHVGTDPWALPDSGLKPIGGAEEMMRKSGYVYVAEGSHLQKIMGPGRPGRGGMVYSLAGLLEQPTQLAGIKGKGSIHSPGEYFAGVWRGIASMGSKEGMLNERFLASGALPGAIRGRLTNATKSVYSAMGKSTSALSASTFDVFVSDVALKRMADSGGGSITNMRAMAGQGTLYGAVRPTPTHSSGHLQMVRVRLSKDLSGFAANGEMPIAMDPFGAWQLGRDVDKDVMDLVAKEKWPTGTVDPAKIINEQVKNSQAAHKAWRGALQGRASAESAYKIGDLGSLAKKALPYFGFGNLPPVAFMGAYSTMAFGSAITENMDPGAIASNLNKISHGNLARKFTGEDVSNYRNLLSKHDPRILFEKAQLLQRNPYQATITKGGTALRSLLDEFLNIPFTAGEMLDRDPGNISAVVEHSIEAAKSFLDDMTGSSEILAKIHTDYYSKMTGADAREEIARYLGTLHGVAGSARHIHYNPGGGTPHLIHGGIGQKKGSLAKLWSLMNGRADPTLESFRGISPDLPISESQAGVADVNAAIHEAADNLQKTGPEVGSQIASFMTKHWKGVAGVGAAILGMRAISSAMTDEDSISSPAPIPRSPQVGMPNDSFNPISLAPPRGYIQPMNGQGYSAMGHGSMSSTNVGSAIGSINMNMASQAGSFATVNIKDSRKFRSYYDMQRASKARSDSDFSTPHQYI